MTFSFIPLLNRPVRAVGRNLLFRCSFVLVVDSKLTLRAVPPFITRNRENCVVCYIPSIFPSDIAKKIIGLTQMLIRYFWNFV